MGQMFLIVDHRGCVYRPMACHSSMTSLCRPRYKNIENDGIGLLRHRFNRQYKDIYIKLGFSALEDALVSLPLTFPTEMQASNITRHMGEPQHSCLMQEPCECCLKEIV